jgi:hypothetical protein
MKGASAGLMNRNKLSLPLAVVTQVLTAIPRRLITITAGVSGVSFAFGVFAGALGYRLISRRIQADQADQSANYSAWTKAKLYERAAEYEIPGRSEMSKDELLDAVLSAAA